MKIKLSKVRFKNFLSSGNVFSEIDLTKFMKSLIRGKNGYGKSTIFSAITYGLFGKTIKKITKAQIVNSINNKNCVVEIEFFVDCIHYMVRRGIKPDIFEIYKDSVLIDQSSVNDYQEYLETHILHSNMRTFLQTSIISVENYKPFMELKASERRDFIEDILDIKVFTVMNELVKTNSSKNKKEIKILELELKSTKEKLILQKKHLDQLESMKSSDVDAFKKTITNNEDKILSLNSCIESDKVELLNLVAQKKLLNIQKTDNMEISNSIRELRNKVNSLNKSKSLFEANSECPTCLQKIQEEHSHSIISDKDYEIDSANVSILKLEELLKNSEELDTELDKISDLINSKNSGMMINTSEVSRLTKENSSLSTKIYELESTYDISSIKSDLRGMAKTGMDIKTKLDSLLDTEKYNLAMLELFKDSGIKSKIIEKYIPIINELMNIYLDKLDFFVSFELDSEFNETIKSRHRDIFTYSSFSAGEKQRIDLAILFTFRQLSKIKNSFSCNLLCMDEILDASIDDDGIDLLIKIFSCEEFSDTNLMIISHKNADLFSDFFDGTYKITKNSNFTEICVVE